MIIFTFKHFTSSFYVGRSQKHKKRQYSHQYLFALSGSAPVKAARKTLMKLTPCVTSLKYRQGRLQPRAMDF